MNHPHKVGRNEPCPCGSGKKYKKCCLLKEETKASAGQPVIRRSDENKIEARLKQFESADYENQIRLFYQSLEDGLMNNDMAFEMLDVLFLEAAEHNDRDRFDALADALKAAKPDMYAKERAYCLEWKITNAVVAKRWDKALMLAEEMAQYAPDNLDTFDDIFDQLSYYGQLSILTHVAAKAWNDIRNSKDLFDWAIDEFQGQAMDWVIFEYADTHPSPESDDPELLRKLSFFSDDLDTDQIRQFIDRLLGKNPKIWSVSDFDFKILRSKPNGQQIAQQNLFDLMTEFPGYLRRMENVPYSKAQLAQEHLYLYIRDRQMKLFKQSDQHSTSPRLLCPERLGLERYFKDLESPQYPMAATFELIPAWLRFLLSKSLISKEEARSSISGLYGTDIKVYEFLKEYISDPAPAEAVRNWRANSII